MCLIKCCTTCLKISIMDDKTKTLYREILERYTRIIWTHKIQLCQADIYREKANCYNNLLMALSVLMSASTLSNIFKWIPEYFAGIVLALLALILTYLTTKVRSLNLEAKAADCERFAAVMHNIRNRYAGLLSDIKAGLLSAEQITTQRLRLENDEDLVYSGIVPHTSKDAVSAAEKALKSKLESTTTDEEISLLVSSNLQIL